MTSKLTKAELKIQFPELYERKRQLDQERAQRERDLKKEKLENGTATDAELAKYAQQKESKRVRTALINGLKRREKLHGKRSSRNKDGVVDLSDMPIPPPKERVSLKHLTGEERIRHCTERRKEWMANMHPNRRRRMRERAKDRQAKFAERKNAAKITAAISTPTHYKDPGGFFRNITTAYDSSDSSEAEAHLPSVVVNQGARLVADYSSSDSSPSMPDDLPFATSPNVSPVPTGRTSETTSPVPTGRTSETTSPVPTGRTSDATSPVPTRTSDATSPVPTGRTSDATSPVPTGRTSDATRRTSNGDATPTAHGLVSDSPQFSGATNLFADADSSPFRSPQIARRPTGKGSTPVTGWKRRTKKTLKNIIPNVRRWIMQKTRDPDEFAMVAKGVFDVKSPRKRAALMRQGVIFTKPIPLPMTSFEQSQPPPSSKDSTLPQTTLALTPSLATEEIVEALILTAPIAIVEPMPPATTGPIIAIAIAPPSQLSTAPLAAAVPIVESMPPTTTVPIATAPPSQLSSAPIAIVEPMRPAMTGPIIAIAPPSQLSTAPLAAAVPTAPPSSVPIATAPPTTTVPIATAPPSQLSTGPKHSTPRLRGEILLPTKSRRRNPYKRLPDWREKEYYLAQAFYLRQDVSKVLPHKRYATQRSGAGRVMLMTVKQAFMSYRVEYPEHKVQFESFRKLMPDGVRLVGRVPPQTCCCLYCLNVKLKIGPLNGLLSRVGRPDRLPSETKMLDFLLCEKEVEERWHRPDCLERKCQSCSDIGARFAPFTANLGDHIVKWSHWERVAVSYSDSKKLELVNKSGRLSDLLKEFIQKDLLQPTQGTTFVQHLHTWFWQFSQYKLVMSTLSEKESMMIEDFSENRKATYVAEVKGAHFVKSQITMHPVVCFYLKDGALKRHSMVFLSDDCLHDHHAVDHFTKVALDALRVAAPWINKIDIWSDGCSSQYKGKGTFADLSLYSGKRVQRCFFGSEHGKGEADGETGVITQAVDRAVASETTNIRHAKDYFDFCFTSSLTKDTPTFQREFFLVGRAEINHKRPITDVVTVPGTRKIHQIERVSDYVIRHRQKACFCIACRADRSGCINKRYVGQWTTHSIKMSKTSKMDTGFVESDEESDEVLDEVSDEVSDEVLDEEFDEELDEMNRRFTESPPPSAPAPSTSGLPRPSLQDGPTLNFAEPLLKSDFVVVKFEEKKRTTRFNAQIISPTSSMDEVQDHELVVSFMKQKGGLFMFPEEREKLIVDLAQIEKKLETPLLKRRGLFQFRETE